MSRSWYWGVTLLLAAVLGSALTAGPSLTGAQTRKPTLAPLPPPPRSSAPLPPAVSPVRPRPSTTPRPVLALQVGHSGPVTVVAFSPDGKSLVTASADGTARLWEAAS